MRIIPFFLASFCLFEYGTASNLAIDPIKLSQNEPVNKSVKRKLGKLLGNKENFKKVFYSEELTWKILMDKFPSFCIQHSCSTKVRKGRKNKTEKSSECEPFTKCIEHMKDLLFVEAEQDQEFGALKDYCTNLTQDLKKDPNSSKFDQLVVCNALFDDIDIPLRPNALLPPAGKAGQKATRFQNILIRLNKINCTSLVVANLLDLSKHDTQLDEDILFDCIDEYRMVGDGFKKLGLQTNYGPIQFDYEKLSSQVKNYVELRKLVPFNEHLVAQISLKIRAICAFYAPAKEGTLGICEEILAKLEKVPSIPQGFTNPNLEDGKIAKLRSKASSELFHGKDPLISPISGSIERNDEWLLASVIKFCQQRYSLINCDDNCYNFRMGQCINSISTILITKRRHDTEDFKNYCLSLGQSLMTDLNSANFNQLVICNVLFNDIGLHLPPTALLSPLSTVDKDLSRLENIIIRLNKVNCSLLVSGKFLDPQNPANQFDDAIPLDCIEEYLKIGPEFEKLGLINNFKVLKETFFKSLDRQFLEDHIRSFDFTKGLDGDLLYRQLLKVISICTALSSLSIPQITSYTCEQVLEMWARFTSKV